MIREENLVPVRLPKDIGKYGVDETLGYRFREGGLRLAEEGGYTVVEFVPLQVPDQGPFLRIRAQMEPTEPGVAKKVVVWGVGGRVKVDREVYTLTASHFMAERTDDGGVRIYLAPVDRHAPQEKSYGPQTLQAQIPRILGALFKGLVETLQQETARRGGEADSLGELIAHMLKVLDYSYFDQWLEEALEDASQRVNVALGMPVT